MLVQKADLESNNWRPRWQIFGMSMRSNSLCNVLTIFASASLKVAEVDLAAARNHIQQFKEISQASEEALASLNTTHDEYKSTTEAQLTASYVRSLRSCVYFMSAHLCLQAQYEALQNTLKNVEQELVQTRTTLAETKRTFESAREEWQADKKTLEGAIVDMTAAEKNLAEDRLFRESNAQAHEERVRVGKFLACSGILFADFCLYVGC
jgi:nucleoprotein TPR